MNIIGQSRKNFRLSFETDQTIKMKSLVFSKQCNGVAFERSGNDFTFERKLYPTVEIAEKFVRVNTGEKITKEVSLAIEKSVATEEDIVLINKLALVPLKAEDVVTYKLTIANNKVDRDQERFNEDVLNSFQKSIVGKGFLFSHNKQILPIGNVYKSAIETGNGQTNLVGWIYILKSSEFSPELIKNIDAGIWRYVSIGFMAPKWVAITDQNSGNVLYYEYQNSGAKEAEALEVSLVWLGAQYGAQVADGKNTNNAQSKNFNPKGASKIMKIIILGKEYDFNVTESMTDEDIVEGVSKMFSGMLDAAVADSKESTDKLTLAQKDVDTFKELLVSETLKSMEVVIKMDDAEKLKETAKLKALSVKDLMEEKDRWQKKASDKSGPAEHQTEGGGPKPVDVKVTSSSGFQGSV